MANPDRWLKPVPSPPGNVSQSDVARIAREKRERDMQPPAPAPPTPPTSDTPRTPRTSRTPRTPPSKIAPERDYAKVANSIVRDAVAGGHFTGKSKQLYDFLYSRTRGAITPTRSVRITKPNLMKGSAIGSERTLLKNIAHLKSIGLLEVLVTDGEHSGNQYTVFLPEEAELPRALRTPPTPPTPGYPHHAGQKVGGVPPAETTVGDVGSSPEDSTVYTDPKTSFKTNTERSDDDEAAAALVRSHKKMIEEITGREATRSEILKLIEVIEVITLEGKIAAARTTVSSAGPFLAEHLRRRLFKKNKQELAVETAQSEATAVGPPLDASQCPDCAGVGWYYPEGKEKGMAKCRHAQLK